MSWATDWPDRTQYNGLSDASPFCSPMAELCQWLGTQKLSGGDRLAQTRQVHIKSPLLQPHTLHMHAPPNPTSLGTGADSIAINLWRGLIISP